MLEEEMSNPSDKEIENIKIQIKIKNTISDMILNLLYYDRKEDENLMVGDIERAIYENKITINTIIELFRKEFTESVNSYIEEEFLHDNT